MTDQPSPASKSTPIPGEGIEAAKVHTSKIDSRATTEALALVPSKGAPRIDSRLLAEAFGNTNKSVLNMVRKFKGDLLTYGKVPFETAPSISGQAETFALLTEDQAFLLLTYSRNTLKVRALKVKMVKAFSDARRATEIRKTEYLDEYHQLHDAIKVASDGSPNERWHHVNANKALNKLVGIGAGQRASAGPLTQSLMAVGCALAAQSVRTGDGSLTVDQRIKAGLQPLTGALALGEVR